MLQVYLFFSYYFKNILTTKKTLDLFQDAKYNKPYFSAASPSIIEDLFSFLTPFHRLW